MWIPETSVSHFLSSSWSKPTDKTPRGQRRLLDQYKSEFVHCAYHVAVLGGGSTGATAARTRLGKDVWNHIRRGHYRPELREESDWGQVGPAPLMQMRGFVERLSPEEIERLSNLFGPGLVRACVLLLFRFSAVHGC